MWHIIKSIFPETIATRLRFINARQEFLMENTFLGIRILITKKQHTNGSFRFNQSGSATESKEYGLFW